MAWDLLIEVTSSISSYEPSSSIVSYSFSLDRHFLTFFLSDDDDRDIPENLLSDELREWRPKEYESCVGESIIVLGCVTDV